MPRSKAQNETIRQESRKRILEHAISLFAAHGYDRTTVQMIAKSAEISQGLLYNYFRSKKEVLQALFEQSTSKVFEAFAAVVNLAPAQKLEMLIRTSFALVQRDRDYWKVLYGARMQSAVLADLGAATEVWNTSVRMAMASILAEANFPQPDVEARVLFAIIDGISQHIVLEPDYPIADVLAAVLKRYTPPFYQTSQDGGSAQ